MDVTLLDRTAPALTATTASPVALNVNHTPLACFVDAHLPDEEVMALVARNRLQVPMPVLLARFTTENYSHERLATLLRLGVKGHITGQPSPELTELICAPLLGYILRETGQGLLRMEGRALYYQKKRVDLSYKISLLCRELIEARGAVVSEERLYFIYNGSVIKLKTHVLETQIGRLRGYFERLGLQQVIPKKNCGGYQLVLD